MNTNDVVHFISGSTVDDFFFFGFIGGLVSYAWYLFNARNDSKNHLGFWAGICGVFLSGCLGGLLAIAIDRAIELSIIVGLVNQVLYLAIMRSVKNGGLWTAIKEVILTYLTKGGKV